jgi:hypothetical protein
MNYASFFSDNSIQLIVTVTVVLLLGGMWFGAVFKDQWGDYIEFDQQKATIEDEMKGLVILLFIIGFVATGLTLVLTVLNPQSWVESIFYSGICSIGLIIPSGFLYGVGSKRPIHLWLVNSSFWFLTALLVGFIFAIWP